MFDTTDYNSYDSSCLAIFKLFLVCNWGGLGGSEDLEFLDFIDL